MKKIINSFILLLVIGILPFSAKADYSEIKAFENNQTRKYFTKDHPKAKGINISIEYPNTWEQSEGERPNIVQKFSRVENDGTTIGCIILIKNLPKEVGFFSDKEIAEEMHSEETIEAMIPPNSEIIQNVRTKYDGQPGALTIYATIQERMGLKLLMYTVQHMFIYSKRLVAVQCSIGGLASNNEKINEMVSQYTPLFKQIGNSIVIQSKWESSALAKEKPSAMEIASGEYWWLTLLISAMLTWGVGLLPPVLIRYIFARRPLSKKAALIIVGIFWFINISFFIAIGSKNKTHFALFLVAVASYYILRAGHEKLEQNKINS